MDEGRDAGRQDRAEQLGIAGETPDASVKIQLQEHEDADHRVKRRKVEPD